MKTKPQTFDICVHKPSGKEYFVRYIRPDYTVFDRTKHMRQYESGYWFWGVMPDKIGGAYSGNSMKLTSKRFTFRWLLKSVKIIFNYYV